MTLKPGQRKCIETLDRSLVVAAGAGSGKTFTLTRRIVHAIKSGAVEGIDRVCAITFTNKAAGELKSRIKAELRACGMFDQALLVDEAWVSTIHGMCARILRAHAIELDLDPAFAMAEAADASVLRDRAIEEVLAGAQAGEEGLAGCAGISRESLDALFAEYPARSAGLRSASVESMLRSLMAAAASNVRGFDAFSIASSEVNPAALVSAVLEHYDALVCEIASQKPNESRTRWAETASERIDIARREMEQGNASDMRWALGVLDGLPLPARTGTAAYKEQVSQAVELYRMCVMELRLALAAPHLSTLVALAQAASLAFARQKRAAGLLDNDDLLVLAYDAVSNHPSIARLYADKFQLVMVDEFQDTDQMQVDMIKKLSGPGACRLCTVGDAQQSIYRFRGADVAVYRRHLEEVRRADPESVILLPDNFRSHADVLSLVDRVFEKGDMFGGEFMSLAPGRDEGRVKKPFPAGVPRIQVQLTTKPYRGVSSDEVRETAAARIAEAFDDIRSHGYSAGDMAVLLGGMAHADVYAAALREKGFSCVISGGSVFAKSPEVQVVLDLARVAANPAHTQALYNVLSGPLFELEPDDLLQLATFTDDVGALRGRSLDRGLFSLIRLSGEQATAQTFSPKLRLALRVMAHFLESVNHMEVARIMEHAIVESGWVSRLEARGPEGLAIAGNVYKAVRKVRDLESSAAVGPSALARAFEAMLEESKEAPGALSATGGDFVRIMTVHASKGLEFPVVAVAGFRETAAAAPKLLVGSAGGRIRLSLDLGNTVAGFQGAAALKDLPGLYADLMEGCEDEDELTRAICDADGALSLRAALFQRDRIGDAEESKRLLYVALTRAREALVVSLAGTRTKTNPEGTPKSCLGSLAAALAGPEQGFDEGVSLLEFGGSAPALVEHVALEAGTAEGAGSGEAEQGEDACPTPQEEPNAPLPLPDGELAEEKGGLGAFLVPEPENAPTVRRDVYRPMREGMFSYSSLAGSSHDSDILERLVETGFVSVDSPASGFGEPADEVSRDLHDDGGSAQDVAAHGQAERMTAWAQSAFPSQDEEFWAEAGPSGSDSDKATDLGTAFHRLAQLAVLGRSGPSLACPSEDRVAALSRTCHLDSLQRERLQAALRRWFASDVAAEMAVYDDLRAEVPFFVQLPHAQKAASDGSPNAGAAQANAFLEGEIDLLGFNEDGSRACVVDYKTGGSETEGAHELARKHVLQAACYSYAIMLQGASEVESWFVRVEQPSVVGDGQPQCVRYRFGESDLDFLSRTIAEVAAASETPAK